MAMILRQSTALTFRIGPFVDANDGKTPETGLTIVQADIQISKDGGAFAQTSEASPVTTHDKDGWYQCPLTTSDIDTVGLFTVQITVSGALPVWRDFEVILASVFDSLPATRAAVDRNAFLIESQREGHTWQGNYFFVDPVNGASHASGARGGRSDPYASVQDCHDNAITDSNHDVIFLVSGDPSAITTLTEDVALTKRYFFIRGPGRDFIWTRSGNGNTISADGADGLELSGFQLETAGTGAGHGIQVTDADFIKVHDVWVNETRGDGINILRGSNCIISDNTFQGTGQTGAGQGIHVIGTAGTSNHTKIFDNVFSDVQGDAIRVEQGTTHHTHIFRNRIHTSTGWGINIGGSSVDAIVHDNILYDNASGNIKDDGTRTGDLNNERWAKHSIATELRLAELDAGNLPASVDAIPTHAGTVYYVDGSAGDDGNDGLAFARAKATITAGIAAAAAGDMVIVGESLYVEATITIPLGKEGLSLILQEGVIISGATATDFVIDVQAVQCRITGGTIAAASGKIGVRVTGTRSIIENVYCITAATSFLSTQSTGVVFIGCRSYDHTVQGFSIGGRESVVKDCMSFSSGAVIGFFFDRAIDSTITNCHSNGNQTAGFSIDTDTENAVFAHCSSGPGDGARIDNGTYNSWPDFRVVEVADTDADVVDIKAVTDAILEDTGTTIPVSIGALPTAAENTANIMAHTPTAGGVTTVEEILVQLFAMARGKISKDGNNYTYFDDDDLAELFTNLVGSSGRTVV